MALAQGPEAYATFAKAAQGPIGLIVLVGLTWSFFQHLLSGIRHLVMDTGAAFELRTNKTFAILTIVGSVLLTAALWAWLLDTCNEHRRQLHSARQGRAASARRARAASIG